MIDDKGSRKRDLKPRLCSEYLMLTKQSVSPISIESHEQRYISIPSQIKNCCYSRIEYFNDACEHFCVWNLFSFFIFNHNR